MFQNNKCQKRRLYVLLVLSLLFKTVPISPLGIGPVLGFVSGVCAQRALDRKCPGEPEDAIRRSYRFLLKVITEIDDLVTHHDEEYYQRKISTLDKKIEEQKALLSAEKKEFEECKSHFNTLAHSTKSELRNSELAAHRLSSLVTKVREATDCIDNCKKNLNALKAKLPQKTELVGGESDVKEARKGEPVGLQEL